VVAKDLSASARRSLKKALEVRGRQGPTFVEYQSSKGEKLIEFLAIEPSEPERPDSALIRKQQEEGVGRCLGKLGRPGRLIEAKWLLGMTNRQLAWEFDISLKTVIAELAKGMKQLRGVIESDPEIDLPKKQT
jgi:DNA-directed RNA polymerase specialized sigma24 family protein